MPRRKHSISDFTGGLNTNADARDIRDNQFAELQNFLIDKNGVIRTLEDTPEANTVDSTLPTVRSGGDISPGSGLFGHPSDRVAADMGSSAAYDSDYFIFKANADNMTMDMFSKTNSQWYNSRISLYDGTALVLRPPVKSLILCFRLGIIPVLPVKWAHLVIAHQHMAS